MPATIGFCQRIQLRLCGQKSKNLPRKDKEALFNVPSTITHILAMFDP